MLSRYHRPTLLSSSTRSIPVVSSSSFSFSSSSSFGCTSRFSPATSVVSSLRHRSFAAFSTTPSSSPSSSPPSSPSSSTTKPVRVRFAPSPTGFLHVGGLRTALYNYAFAKQHHGKFILRIEDTDKSRQVPGSIENLIKALEWCGLTYDEGPKLTIPSSSSSASSPPSTVDHGNYGPYIQSQRLSLYQSYAEQLIQSGHAYRCFCSQERLVALREARAKRGLEALYDRVCTHIPTDQAENRATKGEPHVIRLKVPPGHTTFHDTVLGNVKFQHAIMDDQVLLKSDGYPTYHLASVIDDTLMEITHVIRGQEWLPSTPKHILLYAALQKTPPIFTHLPLLLNMDKTKLSKRHGDAAVEDFQRTGYLPEGLVNFVALLGWTPSNGQEVLTLDDIVEQFSLTNIHKANAMVDRRRLDYFNNEHIKRYVVKGIGKVQKHLLTEIKSNTGSSGGNGKKNSSATTNNSNRSKGTATIPLPTVYRITEEKIPSAIPDTSEFLSLRSTILPLVESIVQTFVTEQQEQQQQTKNRASSLSSTTASNIPLTTIVPKLYKPEYLNAIITAQHERVHTLFDFPALILPFILEQKEYETFYLTKELDWNPQELLTVTTKGIRGDTKDTKEKEKEKSKNEGNGNDEGKTGSQSKWFEIEKVLQNNTLSTEKHTVYTALQDIVKEWKQASVFMPEPVGSSTAPSSPKGTGYDCIRTVAERLKFTTSTKLYQPLRLCLTGTKVGPAFPDLLRLLGRDVCIERLEGILSHAGKKEKGN